MSFFAGQYTSVYSLNHYITCRLEARQALIYQLVLGLTGENGKYNYSKAVHVYPSFFDISSSAKNYKIAPALTVKMADGSERRLPAPDIIPLMLLDGDKKVIDVIGDGGAGNGQLADLFRGIIHEAPEVIL